MSGEAGFGMVELLVALAICAALAMGAGSLINLGLKLRDRVELTADVQQALLDLRGVTSMLAGGSGVGLGDAGDGMFRLCDGVAGQEAKLAGTFTLLPGSARYRSRFAGSRADIAVFQTQGLEYLVVQPGAQEWRVAGALGGEGPVAARLTLGLGGRTWRVLLWMAQPNPMQAAPRGELHCAA